MAWYTVFEVCVCVHHVEMNDLRLKQKDGP